MRRRYLFSVTEVEAVVGSSRRMSGVAWAMTRASDTRVLTPGLGGVHEVREPCPRGLLHAEALQLSTAFRATPK